MASDDPEHLIAMIGCRDLVVIHSGNATLICHRDAAEKIKDLQKEVAARFGNRVRVNYLPCNLTAVPAQMMRGCEPW